jgi:hypothetical protein
VFSLKSSNKVNKELGDLILSLKKDDPCKTGGVVNKEKGIAFALKARGCIGSPSVNSDELPKDFKMSVGRIAGNLVESSGCVADRADVVKFSLNLLVRNINAVANLKEFAHTVEAQVSKTSVF